MGYGLGDIHGDIDILDKLLIDSGIVAQGPNGLTLVTPDPIVFIGDFTDRGPHGIDVLERVISLSKQSDTGMVQGVMGNHDALILSIALMIRDGESNSGMKYWFQRNGGSMLEAEIIASKAQLIEFLQNLPFRIKIGTTLFQHADSVSFYENFSEEWRDESVQTADGAYKIFEKMTNCRYWDREYSPEIEQQERVEQYLDKMECTQVVHGHTRFIGNEPLVYLDGLAVNVDGSMSIGYRNDPERGFIYRFNS